MTPVPSIRRKISLVLFGTFGLALALTATALALFEFRAARTRAQDSLTAVADPLAYSIVAALDFDAPQSAGETLARLQSNPSILAAAVYRAGDEPADRAFARWVRPEVELAFTFRPHAPGIHWSGDRALFVRALGEPGHSIAWLVLEADVGAYRRGVAESLLLLTLVVAVLGAASVWLSRVLERTLTRPLAALAETVAQVETSGDYRVRHAIETPDEIGRLGERFNDLLARIAERDQRLQATGAMQRAVLTYSGVTIVTTDAAGLVRTFNPAAERFLGYPADAVIGRLTPMAWHDPREVAERASQLSAELGRLVSPGFEVFTLRPEGGGAELREWTFVRRDGKRAPGYLVFSALRDAEERIIGYCGIVTDVTERRAAEDALRASEAQFKFLIEGAPDAIVLLDLQVGRFTAVNRAAEALFGLPRAELMKRSPVDLSPPHQPDGRPSAAAAHAYIAAALAGETPVFEWMHLRADGSPVLCEVRLLSLPHGPHPLIRGSLLDVSERKRTEAALRALTEGTASVAGAEFFATAVAQIARELGARWVLIGKFEPGPAGRVVRTLALWSDGPAAPVTYDLADTPCEHVAVESLCHFPERVAELFPRDAMLRDLKASGYLGVQIRDLTGRALGLVAVLDDKPMPTSDAARLLLAATAARAATEMQRLEADADIRRLNADLEQRVRDRTAELQTRFAEVEHLNRELIRTQRAIHDSAGRLQEANANLLAANQELESFSYSVSHDLRAPLRNITGFIELLRKRTAGKLEPEAERYAGIIGAEAQRMGALIDDLLTFSRIGRAELKMESVRLGELVAEVRQELATDLAGREVEWRLGELPAVRGDRTLLRQVVANLIANAVKFTRNRRPAVIEIGHQPGARPSDDGVFFVRDNGAGFNPKYVEKLFRVFQRLHSARDFEGTGIGLANVKRIVTRHGGRVWAEGALDAGATFFFTLRRDLPPTP